MKSKMVKGKVLTLVCQNSTDTGIHARKEILDIIVWEKNFFSFLIIWFCYLNNSLQGKEKASFFTDYSDLIKIVFSPTEWPTFSVYLEEFLSANEEFSSFSLSLISRCANVTADKLARKIRTEPYHIKYVNNI